MVDRIQYTSLLRKIFLRLTRCTTWIGIKEKLYMESSTVAKLEISDQGVEKVHTQKFL
ncbi:hypothetical protein HanRHA438_Chr10g0478131 [Helianthus annuus]|nr:hypothetical protein HanHA300_Chr10g0381241 [Helianthus annuus]KAJ0531687.1 hypothetical protein HanHA89_Chr10g0403701 [Helianthus annuus]KAJ0881802.1 hypothetical protein HanRHA438_Chr10g0478131 [Helianthus annuus]